MSNIAPICIIPARGGSKRLPKKNIVEVGGKPIIAWTIEQAVASGLFGKIIVSTEDEEIVNTVSEIPGIETWMRSEELATDTTTVDDVCLNVLARYKEKENKLPELFCCMYATAILRSVDDIVGSYRMICEEKVDSVMTITEYEQYPHQALKVEESGDLVMQWPELLMMKRQFRPHLVVDAGSIYWADTASFEQNKNFYTNSMKGYPIPRERAIDVDTLGDLELLKFYWEKNLGNLTKINYQ